MGERNIKREIVEKVIGTAERESMRAVHVAKLIKELGINRNTFYYYFGSKYDVALYVFRQDLARTLYAEIPEDEVICLSVAPGKPDDEELPYYMRREIGAHSLDLGDFYKALVHCVMGRRDFYTRLFDPREAEFKVLVDDLYRPVVRDDLRYILGGRYMPDETFDYLTAIYLGKVYLTAQYHLMHSSQSEALLDDRVDPFWNMPYEALVTSLQRHPINRIRR